MLATAEHLRLTKNQKQVAHKSCLGYSRNSDAGGKGKAWANKEGIQQVTEAQYKT